MNPQISVGGPICGPQPEEPMRDPKGLQGERYEYGYLRRKKEASVIAVKDFTWTDF